jgi:small GTP-binding protein
MLVKKKHRKDVYVIGVKEIKEMGELKIMVLGDRCVGKTSLLMTFSSGEFTEEIKPYSFDEEMIKIYKTNLTWKNETIPLDLWDTIGNDNEEYSMLRPLSYPCTNIFLLLFSIVDRNSYKNIKEKWIKEVREHTIREKIILVGTKVDLREDKDVLKILKDNNESPITYKEGEKLCKIIEANAYVEISSKNKIGLNECFVKCVDSLLRPDDSITDCLVN